MICAGCGQPTGWSSDGKHILANAPPGRLWLLELASGRKTDLFPQSKHWLCCGQFSPDGHWLTFLDGTAGRSYVAPFQEGGSIGESGPIALVEGDKAPWSPDGKVVYMLSPRDGYICIWAQRLDQATKRPAGAPFAVFHSHDVRISLANQDGTTLAIGRDKMLFNMGERTGNIWMAEWIER